MTGLYHFFRVEPSTTRQDEEDHTSVQYGNYYDPQLKRDRVAVVEQNPAFQFKKLDLVESDTVLQLLMDERPDRVVHCAAQPGVRYSLQNPMAYIQSNLVGFASVLEACRQAKCPHLVFASSSSV